MRYKSIGESGRDGQLTHGGTQEWSYEKRLIL